MAKRKLPSIPMLAIMIIIGSAIFKEFDFETMRFDNTALASVYIFTFSLCVFFVVNGMRKKEGE